MNGLTVEANFVKVAINVVRIPGETKNALPGILGDWFGSDAGLPGTRQTVEFRHVDGVLRASPKSGGSSRK